MIIRITSYLRQMWAMQKDLGRKRFLPGVLVDKEAAIKSLKWVKDSAKDKHCIEAIANHDRHIQPHCILL